jgi:hypothetical protein
VTPNAANQFQAVQPWHHSVTDYDRKRVVLKGRPSLCFIGRGEDIVPSQRLTEHRARYGIVFGYQDLHGLSPFVGSLLTKVSSLPVAL